MAIDRNIIDFSNADNFDDGFFYNANGVSPEMAQAGVSPEMAQAGVALAAGLISKVGNRPRNPTKDEIKGACGRKPLLLKKKKDAYQSCVNNYLKSKSSASASQQSYTPTSSTEQRLYNPAYVPPTQAKKFLGMPMGVGITVTVLAVAGIAFGAFKLLKK